ncbi:MAG: hypothetical protein R8M71_02500 [Alphaproteobacteria bacterium]|nr:hypothetical protein [Alphaproteobacteria bacterium]
MKYNRLSFLSVLVAMGVMPNVSDAAIRVGNHSRNNAQGYQQVNEQRYQQQNPVAGTNSATVDMLPSQQMDAQAASGDIKSAVEDTKMDSCKMIYPNGTFEWARPTIGMGAGGAQTCTSVVELRVLGQAEDGGDLVVARANLAAGDSFNCNIDSFPDATLLPEVEKVSFPADTQPTIEDVKRVMDEEQKQNAVVKIIGGALLGGLGGNIAGKNEVGKDSMLGGGKDKIISTVVGTVGGAGLMAASTYSGKVAGDMIMSAGVNAAAGAVMGNIVADGESKMRIEKCNVGGVEQTCLWGFIEETGTTAVENAYVSTTNIYDFKVCEDGKKCENKNLTGATVVGYEGPRLVNGKSRKWTLEDVFHDKFEKVTTRLYCIDKHGAMKLEADAEECADDNKRYAKISGAKEVKKRIQAMAVGIKDKPFGYKSFEDLQKDNENPEFVGRTSSGEVTDLPKDLSQNWSNFKPLEVDSSDGGVIDMTNKARLGGTLTGAGIGGGVGAFTAYQGAQSEIDERWVAAVREYKDLLQKFYCGTGTRFLSFYNDTVVIPRPNN